jgi:hypothetical protein
MACPNNLEDLSRVCNTAPGFEGILYVAREDEVSAFGTIVDGVIPTLTMVASKVFSKFEISTVPGKSDAESTPTGDQDAGAFENKFKCFHPGFSGNASTVLSDTRGKSFICIAVDLDGKRMVFGRKNNGVEIKTSFKNDGTKKGYDIEIIGVDKMLPVELAAGFTIPVAA